MNATIPVWAILALLAAMALIDAVWSWFRDQYEPRWSGRLPRFTRRWYGTGAHVCLKSAADGLDIPDRYEVVEWGDDSTDIPWLCVRNLEHEEAEASWGPVTEFSDFYVRRFRPFIAARLLFSGHPVSPFSYHPLPQVRGARAAAEPAGTDA
jgi:hypothetical protein